jgi:hypothetical protein
MTKRKQTAKENGNSSVFLTLPIGLTTSDDEVIAKLRAELSQEDEREVSQRQVIRLALRFAGRTHATDKQFSLIRDETASAMEDRRLKRGREKYKIRSFPVFPKDMANFQTFSNHLLSAGLNHTRTDVVRGLLRALVQLSGRPNLWRGILAANAELRRECAEYDQRRKAGDKWGGGAT